MLVTDSFWVEWINANMAWHHVNLWNLKFSWIQVIGTAFVVLLGKYWAQKAEAPQAER